MHRTRLALVPIAFSLLLLTASFAPAADAPPADPIAAAPVPTLQLYNEFIRCDQTGKPIAADSKDPALLKPIDTTKPIKVARGGYASFHLVVSGVGPSCTISANVKYVGPQGDQPPPAHPYTSVDLYTEWYHTLKTKDKPDEVIPDGLVPYKGEGFTIPNPGMTVPNQTVQAFWVDVWISADAPVGAQLFQLGCAVYKFPPGPASSPTAPLAYFLIPLDVTSAVIPKEDTITADHNCYGMGWVGESVNPWPNEVAKTHPWRFSPEYYGVIHAHHRLAFDNRCVFHQLGTNHVGGFSPEFNPETSGEARTLKIDSWEKFDGHYGPLLDGSGMKGCRRAETYAARPIPTVYTAITPEWPAPFLHWGTPAYEYEFTKIIRAMHDHFAEKGWTHTNFELFFNHKMRNKGFPWDGDEARFSEDDKFFIEYGRLLAASLPLPKDPPAQLRDKFVSTAGVRFIFRMDASWNMNAQYTTLKGVVNMWVMGGGVCTFYPAGVAELMKRGDMVWFYGGTPSIESPAAAIVDMPARAWLTGMEGYCRWLVTQNGGDPWNNSTGGGELLYYPGGLRGFHEPLPCIRLKLERNALQDCALLKASEAKLGGHDELAKKILAMAKLTPDCFWVPDSPLVKKVIIEWNNPDIGDNAAKGLDTNPNLDRAAWWLAARAVCLDAK